MGGNNYEPPEQRFWRRVIKRGIDECWEWTGQKVNDYGFLQIKGVRIAAHRLSYQIHKGSINPESLFVCHECDNPSCVNPKHLFLGTIQDNTADKVGKGRQVKGEDCYWQAKLTEQQVLEIRETYQNRKVAYGPIAARYGVSKDTIYYVLKRITWKHL